MTFAVRLTQESDPLPSLPATAITWSRAGSAIWIDADGTAEQLPVTILFRQGDMVWIDAEIAQGTMVVTEGAQKLRPGAQISTPGGARDKQGRPAAGEEAPAARSSRRQTDENVQSTGSGQRAQPSSEEPT